MCNVRLIDAVPGSGKTRFIVTDAISRIVSGECRADEIGMFTFSNAAADELHRRCRAFPDLWISTIHSYAGHLLRQTGHEHDHETYDHVIIDATACLRAGSVRPAFRVLYIDEAQDLTDVQMQFLHALGSMVNDVVIVGDPMQSIYGFNGSDPSYMFTLADELSHGEYVTTTMYESFRLSSAVAGSVNSLFHTTIVPARSHKGESIVLERLSEDDRASRIADIITQGSGLIIARTNREVLDMYKRLGGAAGALLSVSESPYVTMVCLKHQTVAVKPQELREIAKIFGFKKLPELPEQITGEWLWHCIEDTISYASAGNKEFVNFIWTLKNLCDMLPLSIPECMTMLPNLVIADAWPNVTCEILTHAAKMRIETGENVRILIDGKYDYTILTAHSSKGLEGETVVLLPDAFDNIEKDKHVLYVAMTRAIASLIIIPSRPSLIDALFVSV